VTSFKEALQKSPPREERPSDFTDLEVLIVGYGPVGAVLAGLLGKRGIRVGVVDAGVGLYALPRAAHIDHMALRVLQEFGALDALLPLMLPNPGSDFVTADRRLLFRLPGDKSTTSGLPASMYFYQPTFDGELRRTVAALDNVNVRLGTRAVTIEQDPYGVNVMVRSLSGSEEVIRAKWLVGCDGASSTVRTAMSVERETFGFEEQWLIFDLLLGSPRPPLSKSAVQVCDSARPHTELPMPDNRFRLEFMLMPGENSEEMLRPDVAQDKLLAPLIPHGEFSIERTATYTFQGLVASKWRSGRVFLAGDAAHLMPPFLGQGMCSGIRDVANIAWKLERVIRGWSPAHLLDTYEEERKPHVSRVIQSAVDFGRIICMTDIAAEAKRDTELLNDTRPIDSRFKFSLSRLNAGPLVLGGGGMVLPQPPTEEDAPRLDDWIGIGFFVVASHASALGSSRNWWETEVQARVCMIDDVPDPKGLVRRWLESTGSKVAVVRPDRYVLATTNNLDAVSERVRFWLERVGG
jgi:3-(3-hydroxy-phenyl)propionate hydroxylase